MCDATSAWTASCEALAKGRAMDDEAVWTFVSGDLAEGRSRGTASLAVIAAWEELFARAAGFEPRLVDRLIGLAARVPSGNPMRGLVALLRAARPDGELTAHLDALAARDPSAAGAVEQVRYWLAR